MDFDRGASPSSQASGPAISKASSFRHIFTPKHPGSIDDHYQLEEVLGQGSFGVIYKGTAKDSESRFKMDLDGSLTVGHTLRAVKAVSTEGTHRRFEEEVQIQRQLDHPNVLKLFEIFQDKARYYLVMELCTGGELFDKVVEAGGSFNEATCSGYMRQLLAAVNYLHGHLVVHRDIKPENLLLQNRTKDAPLKLIDFGCARTFATGETMTTSLGTPLYVAPEVLRRRYGPQCDVWSCGVIMYVLLCGSPPFLAQNEEALLRKVEAGSFEYDEDDWEGISDAAKGLIDQMLILDPKDRPPAADLLANTWLGEHPHVDGRLPVDLTTRLRSFRACSQFKKVALSLAAQLSNDEDIKSLQQTFAVLDQNEDGSLTYTEIAEGLTQHGAQLPPDFLELVRIADTDGSGFIDYTEFIALTLSRKQYLREELLWSSFRTFDLDCDGKISREEFAQVVSMSDQADIAQMFQIADISGDGQIDFSEFRAMMQSQAANEAPV